MFEELASDPNYHKISDALPYWVYDLAPSNNVDMNIKKYTLDDIKPEWVEGYPKLIEGEGNYENSVYEEDFYQMKLCLKVYK